MENENVKTENKKAPRKCSHCGAGMFAGYLIDDGAAYYCSDACLHANMSPAEYAELYDDGNGSSFYTEWTDDDADDDDDDDDDDDAPDPETCELHEAVSYALGSLEADALDVLETCAARYERELDAARAELAAAREQLAIMAQELNDKVPGLLLLRVSFTPADGCSSASARAALKNDFDLYLQSLAHGGLPEDVKNARVVFNR